jgi:hypothetical protein
VLNGIGSNGVDMQGAGLSGLSKPRKRVVYPSESESREDYKFWAAA